jgi:hypothetical protein
MNYQEKVLLLWPAPEAALNLISDADTRIAVLQAENAELRKDAERYRWLREGFRAMSPRIDGKPFWVPRASVLGNLSGPTLDAAIDDAAATGAAK